jgi:hypothetical protein
MTTQTTQIKQLLAAIVLLILIIAATLGFKYWKMAQPERTLAAQIDASCDLHRGPCSATLSDGGRIELEISPRPIPLLRPLEIRAKITGMQARRVEIDFSGVSMNMGFNRPVLKDTGNQTFTGQATLPVCITGRMEWQASVMVNTDEAQIIAPFHFEAAAKI